MPYVDVTGNEAHGETEMKYAVHNTHADMNNGSHGFLNTWEVSRFATGAERDAFVANLENKKARAITRREAIEIWRGAYLSVGKAIPAGGLFTASDDTRFWNENQLEYTK